MSTASPKILALIVAAGSGSRFGGEVPKAYAEIAGKPMLRRCMETFLSHPRIGGVRVVVSRAHHPLYRKLSQGLTLYPCVMGGIARQDSVRLGLQAVARAEPDFVLIHDAARPGISHALIDRVIAALEGGAKAVLPALPVADTLRRAAAPGVYEPVARENLLAAQTPQGFDFPLILELHNKLFSQGLVFSATDDIALAEAATIAVEVVAGERRNFKVTTQEDKAFMENILAQQPFETRTGMGLDVHNFVPFDPAKPASKRTVSICGVKIPFEQRLSGHSDADVGLHALVDAILGTICAGDIGMHFPNDDPKWAGADSGRFLIHAYQLLRERGGELVHIDITIIGERPKIAPHREEMQARVADILKLSPGRVSIKATTTEKLGFLGRGEGIAAQAVATVRLPVV